MEKSRDNTAFYVYHFSGVQKDQSFGNAERIDLDYTSLAGTDLYCDPESEEILASSIRTARADGKLPALRFFDSGNYHYMSKLLAQEEEVEGGLVLVVLDHHTDMQPSGLLPILSCGSWIFDLLLTLGEKERNKLKAGQAGDFQRGIRKIISIGPPQALIDQARELLAEAADDLPGNLEILFFSEEELQKARKNAGPAEEIKAQIFNHFLFPGDRIYLSVDKDVLSKDQLDSTWDQGILSCKELEDIIGALMGYGELCFMDVCGEPEVLASDFEIRKSEAINQRLYQLFCREKG